MKTFEFFKFLIDNRNCKSKLTNIFKTIKLFKYIDNLKNIYYKEILKTFSVISTYSRISSSIFLILTSMEFMFI